MLSKHTLEELNTALQTSPSGLVILESGQPRFAVVDFDVFTALKEKKVESQSKINNILVTGGAGYIGSHAVQMLRDHGYNVTVYDNLSTGREEAVKDAKLVVADLADQNKIEEVLRENKIDAVMHFAASIEVGESVENPAKYYQNNVVNGLNLLNAMRSVGVTKIVFSSTAAVYGEPKNDSVNEESPCQPINPYGESKLIFEKILKAYARAYGIDSISLRYFNAAGAWPERDLGYRKEGNSHLIPRVMDVAMKLTKEIEVYGQNYATPDGTGIRDYIHVLDLAEAHIAALQKLERSTGADVYNVGTGKGNSVLEVIDTAVEITQRMIPMKVSERRAGDPRSLVADASRLMQELGWEPRFGIDEILKSSWLWHKKLNA